MGINCSTFVHFISFLLKMSKPSNLSKSLKLFHSLHLVLTFASIGGILYLVFSLHETQNELKHLKDSCAFCDILNSIKTENNISGSNYQSMFDKDAQNDLQTEGNEKREKRELKRNQTCTKMILDFIKLLEVTNKLVCIKQGSIYIDLKYTFFTIERHL